VAGADLRPRLGDNFCIDKVSRRDKLAFGAGQYRRITDQRSSERNEAAFASVHDFQFRSEVDAFMVRFSFATRRHWSRAGPQDR
jgi:hypothetical protein